MELQIIFSIIILIISIVLHEVAHGYTALLLGDPTAKLQGRLTLNPLKHIDPLGSIIVPILTSLGGFTFGWAKPVVYNPYNLKNRRWGEFLIALAGPVSNLFIAFVFGLLIRFGGSFTTQSFIDIAAYAALINVTLAIFNLIPVAPLDGTKVLFALLPQKFLYIRELMERYALVLMLLVVLFLWQIVAPIIPFIFKLLTGLALS